jgi:hypothetical protein
MYERLKDTEFLDGSHLVRWNIARDAHVIMRNFGWACAVGEFVKWAEKLFQLNYAHLPHPT